jgi:hypothetical protein
MVMEQRHAANCRVKRTCGETKTFPRQVLICDGEGLTVRIFKRIAEPSKAANIENAVMTEDEMVQTLHDVFASS